MGVQVRLGALNFSGSADSDGDKFTLEEADGFDTPEFDIALSDSQQDGQVFERMRLKSRSITISGMAYTTGSNTVDVPWRLRKKLGELLAALYNNTRLQQWTLMSVDEPPLGRAWVANVIPATNPLQIKRNGPYSVRYQLQLTAPDPRKYSPFISSAHIAGGSTVIVANGGTVSTPWWATVFNTSNNPGLKDISYGPELRTIGTMGPGWGISQFGQSIYDASGVGHFDMWDPTSSWFFLPVGIFSLQALNGSNLDVYWRAAWL